MTFPKRKSLSSLRFSHCFLYCNNSFFIYCFRISPRNLFLIAVSLPLHPRLLSSVFQLNQAGRKADYSYPLSSAISYFSFAMFLFFYYNVRSFYAQVKNSFILLLYSYFLYMQLILCKHCVFLSKSQHRPFTINCITIRTKSCCHSHPNG